MIRVVSGPGEVETRRTSHPGEVEIRRCSSSVVGWETTGAGAWRMHDAGHLIWVCHAHFAFEPVGVTEEDAEHRSEVGDEVISCTSCLQPLPDGFRW